MENGHAQFSAIFTQCLNPLKTRIALIVKIIFFSNNTWDIVLVILNWKKTVGTCWERIHLKPGIFTNFLENYQKNLKNLNFNMLLHCWYAKFRIKNYSTDESELKLDFHQPKLIHTVVHYQRNISKNVNLKVRWMKRNGTMEMVKNSKKSKI